MASPSPASSTVRLGSAMTGSQPYWLKVLAEVVVSGHAGRSSRAMGCAIWLAVSRCGSPAAKRRAPSTVFFSTQEDQTPSPSATR